ncbi:flavin reductase family protein [Deltaproteobacteria bacterium OttesenSCG-928-M10]|nr:flavin reductase family protein [Deltaproteobacteria bacterium OttesenSCG-928-M10]
MKKSIGAKTAVFPVPIYLVGTYDADGNPNIMTAAWGGVVGSDPPCLGVAVRPSRLTHDNIMTAKAFTASVPNSSQAGAVDFAGIVSGRKHDKFKEAGFTPVASGLVKAPYAAECPLVIECELYKTLDLEAHTLFVGRIVDVKIEESFILPDGRLDMLAADPLVYNSGGDQYHRVGPGVGQAFSIGKRLK